MVSRFAIENLLLGNPLRLIATKAERTPLQACFARIASQRKRNPSATKN
jgi:hypothetical protein